MLLQILAHILLLTIVSPKPNFTSTSGGDYRRGYANVPPERYSIPAKSQVLLALIRLNIPKDHVVIIYSIKNPFPREPLGCSGILNPSYFKGFTLLVGNLTDSPLAVDPKLHIAYVHPLAFIGIARYGLYGLMRDLGLPDPLYASLCPPIILIYRLLSILKLSR